MHTNKLSLLKLILFLNLSAIINSGCVSLADKTPCHVPDHLSLGGVCAHTNTTTDVTFALGFSEMVDLLQPQPVRTCVPVNQFLNVCKGDQTKGTPVKLPARAGGVIFEASQYQALKTELETTCRMLGPRCDISVTNFLSKMNSFK